MEDVIFTRRSIRNYIKDRPVEDEKIEYILKAAMYAPSANNTRNWEFIVVKNRDSLESVTKAHPYAQMLKTAPLAIVVCADIRGESNEAFWQQNCSAALQNIMLAAKTKGLGSVWISVTPIKDRMEAVTKIFNIPEYIKPLGMVAIGYTEKEPPQQDRFEPNKIHYEKY